MTPKEENEAAKSDIKPILKAMEAVAKDAKDKGLRKGNGGQGACTCPVCTGGMIDYKVSSYNGHIWAACSTKGCVAWIS